MSREPSTDGATVDMAGATSATVDTPRNGRHRPAPRPSEPRTGATTAPVAVNPRDAIGGLLDDLREWLHLPDAVPVLAALAVAVTASDREGEPAWLLLVAPPSSGKTEIVRMLDGTADARLDEITIGGLLTWRATTRGKPPSPAGVLTRVRRGLLTLGDLSTLLATSDRGGRDQVFAAMRRVYDGRFSRDVATPGGGGTPGPLTWEGRLTVVGAVTGAIDGYSAHADALGARWLYVRLPARDATAKRQAAALARRSGLDEHRDDARKVAARIIADGRGRVDGVAVPDVVADVIEDAALTCCWGRASVPRHGYGRREIDGVVVVEEPMRVVKQLMTMARGLLALGCSGDDVTVVCRRVALDSMPAPRRAVLEVLALGTDNATTATVARAAEVDRGVARRALEELEAVGVVRGRREGPEPSDDHQDRRYCYWELAGQDGDLMASVFADFAASKIIECLEKGGTHTQTPPE